MIQLIFALFIFTTVQVVGQNLFVAGQSIPPNRGLVNLRISNNLDDEIIFPKAEIYAYGFGLDCLRDLKLAARTSKTLMGCQEMLDEFKDVQVSKETKGRWAVFYLSRNYKKQNWDQLGGEIETIYWNKEQPDWQKHVTCMVMNGRKYTKGNMEIVGSVWECLQKQPTPNTVKSVFVIDINPLHHGKSNQKSPSLPAPFNQGSFKRSPSKILVEFFNMRPIMISIQLAWTDPCIDAFEFAKKILIGHKAKRVIEAHYSCGWLPPDPITTTRLYFYINDGSGGIRGHWAIGEVQVRYFQEGGYPIRECWVSSGRTKAVHEHDHPIVYQGYVTSCNEAPYYIDMYKIIVSASHH